MTKEYQKEIYKYDLKYALELAKEIVEENETIDDDCIDNTLGELLRGSNYVNMPGCEWVLVKNFCHYIMSDRNVTFREYLIKDMIVGMGLNSKNERDYWLIRAFAAAIPDGEDLREEVLNACEEQLDRIIKN